MPFVVRASVLVPVALLVGTLAGPVASATVRPFLAPAHAVCQSMKALEAAITQAVVDHQVQPVEKTQLERLATGALNAAQRLVTAQGAPAIPALELVLRHIRTDRVANRGPLLTQTLATARAAVWTQAVKDRATNPFAALRGYRAVATGIVAHTAKHRGQPAWFVAVDLAQPRVRLLTNAFKMEGRDYASVNVANRARTSGAQAAINGDFFANKRGTHPLYKPSGYAKSNGVVWPLTDVPRFEPSILWTGQHVQVLPGRKPIPEWAQHVVSARPLVLADGKAMTEFDDPTKAGRSRRTGVGLSEDGRMLVFVASVSASATEIGQLLKSAGAYTGFTMDAGGSAQLYLKGHGYAQPSSDGPAGRRVANVLMVRFK